MINGKKVKTLSSILICCFCCLCFSSCSREYSSTKEEDYISYLGEVADAELYMPKLEELGDYDSILLTRKTRNDNFFDTTESIALIVQYSPDGFETFIGNINEKYDFINSQMDNYKDFEAEVEGYHFKVDSNSLLEMIKYPSNEKEFYPSCSLLVGINRLENKIAYLYYWDIEIHEMNNLDKFIEEKFVFN